MKYNVLTITSALLLLSLVFATSAHAQSAIYYFIMLNGDLKADTTDGQKWGPDLTIVGNGGMVTDNLPLLNMASSTVFEFTKGTALKFNDSLAGNFLGKDYTIEIYYRMSNVTSYSRLLEFGNFKGSDTGLYAYSKRYQMWPYACTFLANSYLEADKYQHLVFTRSNSNNALKAYHNGTLVTTTFDLPGAYIVKNGPSLIFFKDNTSEESGGRVAFIVLRNFALTDAQVQSLYDFYGSLSVSEISATKISLFPNPTANSLHISSDVFKANCIATITDLAGRKVKEMILQEVNTTIDVAELSSGFYYLRLSDGVHVATKKFAKQ